MKKSKGQHSRWRIAMSVFLVAMFILATLKNAKLLVGLMQESPDLDKIQLILPELPQNRSTAKKTVGKLSLPELPHSNGIPQSYHNKTVDVIHNTNSSRPFIATAVIAEMRCHSAFSATLHAAIDNLGPEVLLLILHSHDNELFVRGIVNSSPALARLHRSERLTLRRIDPADYTIPCGDKPDGKCGVYSGKFWYSRLFVDAAFWSSFRTPYVLTLQSDTLLCRPFPTQELIRQGASFVGGVSGMMGGFKHYTPLSNPRPDASMDHGEYLNGGLSFRNVKWVLDCIATYGHRPEGWIEDELYRHCREKNINGTVHATEVAAYTFSSDNGVTMCFTYEGKRICPLGVHKPWNPNNVRSRGNPYMELVRSCPGLTVLQQLHRQGNQYGKMCKIHDLNGTSEVINFRCDCAKK
mmetsp:Transcript_5501/g.12006  ORF Transcript_5501/g.12006 Transcript_5501/m.12006 type:complete len:410 (+) Transcript_5501:138-1367(+)